MAPTTVMTSLLVAAVVAPARSVAGGAEIKPGLSEFGPLRLLGPAG